MTEKEELLTGQLLKTQDKMIKFQEDALELAYDDIATITDALEKREKKLERFNGQLKKEKEYGEEMRQLAVARLNELNELKGQEVGQEGS